MVKPMINQYFAIIHLERITQVVHVLANSFSSQTIGVKRNY